MAPLARPPGPDDVAAEVLHQAVAGRVALEQAVAPDREDAAGLQEPPRPGDERRPVEPVRRLCGDDEVGRAGRQRHRLRRFLAVLDARMPACQLQLPGARLESHHGIEVFREPDRGLAVTGGDVHRQVPRAALPGEPGIECRWIIRTVPFIGARMAREVVLERGRGRHRVIVARQKKTPGF
jgi:hypothetical protein